MVYVRLGFELIYVRLGFELIYFRLGFEFSGFIGFVGVFEFER